MRVEGRAALVTGGGRLALTVSVCPRTWCRSRSGSGAIRTSSGVGRGAGAASAASAAARTTSGGMGAVSAVGDAGAATRLQEYLLAPATQAAIRAFRYPELDQQVWWPAGRHNESRE